MAKFFTGQLIRENPDYIVFIKDAKGENFRHKLYSEYKATREKMPDNLQSQITDIESMIRKMNIDIVEIPGYEADDVIATLAKQLSKDSNDEVYILSGDKDLYALVDEQVKIYDTQKKKISGPEETFEKFWVWAQCVRDYLAICGDSSDNIPWIAGIWPKKAQVLLNEFWNLESIYKTIDDIENQFSKISEASQKILKGKTLEKFIEGRENAFLSQKLATLEEHVALKDFSLEKYEFKSADLCTESVMDFFKELEFHSLVLWTIDEKKQTWGDLWKTVHIVWDQQWLEDLETEILSWKHSEIVLDTETTSLNPREAKLVGVSILVWDDSIYYINHMHGWSQIATQALQDFLHKILASSLTIIGHNIKYDIQVIDVFFNNSEYNIASKKNSTHWQTSLEI